KQKPDLLLVDFQLGARMTGVELIQAIRERLGDEVPAVLVTADKQPELRQQCLERGITFLGKPVKPAAMRAVLNRYQARIHGAPKAPASNQQC
ncbi:MAG: response regulator, partial [Endozoicomonas sp.]